MFPHTRHPEDGEAAAQEKERLHLIHGHYRYMFTKKKTQEGRSFQKNDPQKRRHPKMSSEPQTRPKTQIIKGQTDEQKSADPLQLEE